MRKDLTREVNNEIVYNLLNVNPVFNCGLCCSMEGSLQDEYLFINYDYKQNKGIILGHKHRVRHYIIIREKYLNEWSSTLVATETDNENEADKFCDEADQQADEREREEIERERQAAGC